MEASLICKSTETVAKQKPAKVEEANHRVKITQLGLARRQDLDRRLKPKK